MELTTHGRVEGVDPRTGSAGWSIAVDGGLVGAAAVDGGIVLLTSSRVMRLS